MMARLENYYKSINFFLKRNEFGVLNFFTTTHIFCIEDNIKYLLLKTNNTIVEKKIPFNNMFIDTTLKIEDISIFGLRVSFDKFGDDGIHIAISVVFDWNNKAYAIAYPLQKNLLHYTEDLVYSEKYVHSIKPWEKIKPHLKQINLFVCNFLDFLNNPEVELVTIERTKEENEKRILRGKNPTPPQSFVNVTGKLKIYLDELKSNTNFSYNHRFDVRGHFRTLRSEKWKKSRGMKIWIPPYIKGKGMYIKKVYDVKK